MKRQATKYLALTISAIMAVSLTACGDGSDSSADAALTPVEAEPILRWQMPITEQATSVNSVISWSRTTDSITIQTHLQPCRNSA